MHQQTRSIERGDPQRPKVGLKSTKLRVHQKGHTVLEDVSFDFDVSGEGVNLKSEEINCVICVEEHFWSDLVKETRRFEGGKTTIVRRKSQCRFSRSKKRSARKSLANVKRRKKQVA